jgi:UDP-3-O-[3-hydroxymyristoyl] glucosamine N-acyltransferase
MGDVKASQIADFLQAELHGQDNAVIGIATAKVSDSDDQEVFCISYTARPESTITCRALYLIPIQGTLGITCSYIRVKNPRLAFIRVVNRFFKDLSADFLRKYGSLVQDRRRMHGLSTLPQIGEGTIIRKNAVISPCVQIGTDCLIHSGAVIGSEGFGFERDENGVPQRFPHIRRVIIGDRVEIGANNVIARGALSDTIIGDDVKIDGSCFIAHGVEIGARTMIAARAEISGSVKIGTDCWIGPGSVFKDHVIIGDRAFIGVGAVVIGNVESDAVMVGNPARFLRKRNKDDI